MNRYHWTLLLASVFALTSSVAVAISGGVSGPAQVRQSAQRVGSLPPPPVLFPIDPKPRCELIRGFGAYSKTFGAGNHEGLDIGADLGQEVLAVQPGVLYREVDSSTAGLGWGLLSITDTKYMFYHLSKLREGLEVGDFVNAGDVIGYVGDTGNATPGGYHLHFEVRPGPDYEPVNPYPYLTIPSTCKDYVGPNESSTTTTTTAGSKSTTATTGKSSSTTTTTTTAKSSKTTTTTKAKTSTTTTTKAKTTKTTA